jgi:hypothetical protein
MVVYEFGRVANNSEQDRARSNRNADLFTPHLKRQKVSHVKHLARRVLPMTIFCKPGFTDGCIRLFI